MFSKILIANRGEIACRIIKTCQRLGIHTVAVYSEPDANLPHVSQADESYCIGPAPSRDSYLHMERLIAIAHQSGAEAIHPGYGFLSEKADFAAAVEAADLVFIGPSPTVIQQMGDKIDAKALALQAGVHLVPGTSSPLQSPQEAIDFLALHPGPALLKAAAGGGGKGMRIVYNADEIPSAFERVQSEAESSFGDSRIFIERYIENPRHIEIQILGDKQGNIIHLGERDCSLQRRHQKVIEETPSPILSSALRDQMTEQALQLAKRAGYYSAGTVEFILSPNNEFYFLEMNTRLQVEHPITEAFYNIDIVEWMIRIAYGESLSFSQADLTPQGHAVEARLYAEDADQNFLPDAGRLIQFYCPKDMPIRFDTGMGEGDQVSIYYDPMIAKVIAHTLPLYSAEPPAAMRQRALIHLSSYLEASLIEGIISNQDFLVRLLRHPNVQAGHYHTHFIQDHLRELTRGEGNNFSLKSCVDPSLKTAFILAAVSAASSFPYLHRQKKSQDPLVIYCLCENEQYETISKNIHTILLDEREYRVEFTWLYQRQIFQLTFCHQDQYHTYMGRHHMLPTGCKITLAGETTFLRIAEPDMLPLLKLLPTKNVRTDVKTIHAPMPGTLLRMEIKLGEQIKQGQSLLIIEAMKMQNILKSPIEGVIEEIYVKEGDSLARNQVIARFA